MTACLGLREGWRRVEERRKRRLEEGLLEKKKVGRDGVREDNKYEDSALYIMCCQH